MYYNDVLSGRSLIFFFSVHHANMDSWFDEEVSMLCTSNYYIYNYRRSTSSKMTMVSLLLRYLFILFFILKFTLLNKVLIKELPYQVRMM